MANKTTKKRKRFEHVWEVRVTHFLDDYKTRGSDWSNTRSELFETEELARAYERQCKTNSILEHIDGLDAGDCSAVFPFLKDFDFENDQSGQHVERLVNELSDEDLSRYYAVAVDGEFVRVREEIQIEAKRVRSSVKKRNTCAN